QSPTDRQRPADSEVTILFYADTRMDPIGNYKQEDHKKFIDKILENEKNNGINYLLFGGDSELFGFFKFMWKWFFGAMKKFEVAYPGIKIYPAIGNHELILSDIFKKNLTRLNKNYQGVSLKSIEKKLEKDIDNNKTPTPFFKELYSIYEKSVKENENGLGILNTSTYENFSWERFKYYVDAWPHLKGNPNIQLKKTYYSFNLPIGNSGRFVKIIVVDSNKKNLSAEQRKWYANELQFTGGPVITICHHPLFYPETGNGEFSNWRVPPHLFLVGHVHDYERRSQDGGTRNPPFHIISGSGGVPLGGIDPKRCSDPTTKCIKSYNYCRITINLEKISVIVFGCDKIDNPLTPIDQMAFNWNNS
ncbi:MAG TPA: metallophosphoesterase, partial [Candidatus Kapabacteria bacterium]|nr:metallophosphoesterase [Candidatus Kapabacteria bacterium]